jgi:hypothetical protein
MKLSVCIFIFLGLLYTGSSFCQNVTDSTRILRVETVDGNVFIGNVVSKDSLNLVIKTDIFGEIKIPLNNIKSRTEFKDLKKVGRQYWLPNPQSSRYFWAPNGYGLEKGSSYYQNIWILYNQFSFGLSDNISVGAGMLPLFLFGGAPTPFWVVPKLSIPIVKDKFNIGAGAFLGTLLGNNSGAFGLLYGTSTLGSRDQNMSLGLAYGFADGNWMKIPIINASFMLRVSPRGYLISENYIITTSRETLVLISMGGRSLIRNISLDYSLWIPFGTDTLVAIPFLGVTIPINSKKQNESLNKKF